MSDAEMGKLVQKLFRTARDIEDRTGSSTEVSIAIGTIMSFMKSLHDALPDNHHLKEYIPRELAILIEEMGEREVMRKLES